MTIQVMKGKELKTLDNVTSIRFQRNEMLIVQNGYIIELERKEYKITYIEEDKEYI